MELSTKRCSKCGVEKPVSEFWQRAVNKDGLSGHCKQCTGPYHSAKKAQYVAANKDRDESLLPQLLTCTRCKQEKAASEFYRDKRSATGRESACILCEKERARRSNKERIRSLKRYCLTLDDYACMLALQGGLCAICLTGEPKGNGNFHVDHDHDTGRVRGLLCSACNTAIGLLKESPKIMMAACEYLDASDNEEYMEVVKETSPSKGLQVGHTTVGLTPIKLSEKFPLNRGIVLRCPGTLDPTPNTACVWVGGPNVKADSSAQGGVPIPPGGNITIPVDDPSQIYLISTAASQDVAWLGI